MRGWKEAVREVRSDLRRSFREWLDPGVPMVEVLRDSILYNYISTGYDQKVDPDILYDLANEAAQEAIKWLN